MDNATNGTVEVATFHESDAMKYVISVMWPLAVLEWLYCTYMVLPFLFSRKTRLPLGRLSVSTNRWSPPAEARGEASNRIEPIDWFEEAFAKIGSLEGPTRAGGPNSRSPRDQLRVPRRAGVTGLAEGCQSARLSVYALAKRAG